MSAAGLPQPKTRRGPIALMKTDPALLTETDPPSEKGFFLSKEKASEKRGSVVVSAKAERNGM